MSSRRWTRWFRPPPELKRAEIDAHEVWNDFTDKVLYGHALDGPDHPAPHDALAIAEVNAAVAAAALTHRALVVAMSIGILSFVTSVVAIVVTVLATR